MSDQDDLHTYLNNHLAGGTGAIEMAEYCQAAHEGAPLAEFLAELVVEIQKDHRTLGELLSSLDATENRLKQVVARMGEKASHLKLGAGDLGTLLTLETLSLGIEGKASMWKSLLQIHDPRGAFLAFDFDALIKRADDQRRALEPWRLAAAAAAFNEKAAS